MAENFQNIYHAYKDLAWSIINYKRIPSADADDVFIEIWISVKKSLPSYRGEARLQSWIGTIASRRCADYWSSRPDGVTMVYLDDEEHRPRGIALDTATPVEKLISKESVDLVRDVLAELDDERRFVIEKRIEGFSYREIAELLAAEKGIPPDVNRVGKKLFEARVKIRVRLEEKGIIESGKNGNKNRRFPDY